MVETNISSTSLIWFEAEGTAWIVISANNLVILLWKKNATAIEIRMYTPIAMRQYWSMVGKSELYPILNEMLGICITLCLCSRFAILFTGMRRFMSLRVCAAMSCK